MATAEFTQEARGGRLTGEGRPAWKRGSGCPARQEDEHVTRISTDPSEIDLDWLHSALSERSYWALGRSRELVERSVANSLCYSALDGPRQIGFARVVTDQATFAWVCDVFVDEDHRGRGIGRMLMAAVTDDPRLA